MFIIFFNFSHFDERVVQRLAPQWEWRQQCTLLMLPLYHSEGELLNLVIFNFISVYGFIVGLNCLLNGSTGVTMKKFDLDLFCRIIQEYKVELYRKPFILNMRHTNRI